MSFIVSAPMIVAHTTNGDLYLNDGATVPDSVSEEEVQRLVDGEFVVEVPDSEPEVEPEPEPVDPTEGLDLDGLKAYAEAHRIDLGRASTEDGIRTKIREATPAEQV